MKKQYIFILGLSLGLVTFLIGPGVGDCQSDSLQTPISAPVPATDAAGSQASTDDAQIQDPEVASPLPVIPSQKHRLNPTLGPLALLSDEVRVDGLAVKEVDSSTSRFPLLACAYSQGTTSHLWLPDPRSKDVLVSNITEFYLFGSPAAQLDLNATTGHPFHVTVIGMDAGAGKPLVARVVWIERVSGAEAAYVALHIPATTASLASNKAVQPYVQTTHPTLAVGGHTYPALVVHVRLSSVRVRVGLAAGQLGATESLEGIARDHGAIAAMNGSFFDCYDAGPKMPDMELISKGETVFKSDLGTLIGFTDDGQCVIERSTLADELHGLDPAYPAEWPTESQPAASVWQRVSEAIGAGPRLVRDGKIALSPYAEGMSSSEVLESVARRSAVGYTSQGELLMVSTTSSLPTLAHMMKALGCAQAMNLDGGASSGLWVKGAYLLRPGRELSNALLIEPRQV